MAERQPWAPEEALHRLANLGARIRRGRSVSVKPADHRVDREAADEGVTALGEDAGSARRLFDAAEAMTRTIRSLSVLTAEMAVDYIDRLLRPIPSLAPEVGIKIVTNAYAAHLAAERDPSAFGAEDVPVLGTLPPLKHGRPPQDILTRAVKATRRGFPAIRAVDSRVWDGYLLLLTSMIHEATRDDEKLVATDVVDGLARFGWVLRQVDIHYELGPEFAG